MTESGSTIIYNYLHFNRPTQEQKDVLKALENFISKENQDDFLILCGAAGTGKTSVTAAFIGLLNTLEIPYRIAAPTGRAARILGRKANTYASTIHSLIYNPVQDDKTGKVKFKFKRKFDIDQTFYIVDEASMIQKNVDQEAMLFEVENGLIFDLVRFIKGANPNNKIIFLGDRYQLPPIGELQSYALNKDYLMKAYNLTGTAHLLTEVKRQEDGSYILENAIETRKAIDRKERQYPIKGSQSRNIYSAADNYVADIRSKGLENSVAIGVSHKANNFFNDLVRQRIFKTASKILEAGELLIVTQNWRRNGINLYNGDHVELLAVDWDIQEQVAGLHFVAVKIKLLFSEKEIIVDDYILLESITSPGGRINIHSENELRHERYTKNPRFRESKMPWDDRYVGALRLIYGHAITCNKAQGGEWNKVFINTFGIPSLKWQYTAVTRGITEIEKF